MNIIEHYIGISKKIELHTGLKPLMFQQNDKILIENAFSINQLNELYKYLSEIEKSLIKISHTINDDVYEHITKELNKKYLKSGFYVGVDEIPAKIVCITNAKITKIVSDIAIVVCDLECIEAHSKRHIYLDGETFRYNLQLNRFEI